MHGIGSEAIRPGFENPSLPGKVCTLTTLLELSGQLHKSQDMAISISITSVDLKADRGRFLELSLLKLSCYMAIFIKLDDLVDCLHSLFEQSRPRMAKLMSFSKCLQIREAATTDCC